jgi:hypothetical protein
MSTGDSNSNGGKALAVATRPEGAAPLSEKAIGKDGKISWPNVDSPIEHAGHKIILPAWPENMPLAEARRALEAKEKDEEQIMAVFEEIDAHPMDGAVAFTLALRQKYGWANSVPTPGFFGPEPPVMLTVDIGPNPEDQIQVPWGGFQIPGIKNPVYTDVNRGEFGPVFVVHSKLKKKESYILKDLANLTRQIVKEHSIYRGKAIRLRTDDDGDLNVQLAPKFIETGHIKPEELILADNVLDAVETNIFTLIKHTQACLDAGVPLKRGILLEGTYGCGKTLTAGVTAKHCVDHGWTYITLDKCQALETALHFARRYEPCVIFAEDIDRMTAERDEQANDLLNILDGVLSKNAKVIVVLTTNHVEKINKAMMRPGRLDAVISVLPPDAKAVEQLIRMYGRDRLAASVKLDAVSQVLAGKIPAVIREVVERSKLAMIQRGDTELAEADLLRAAQYMENHFRLMSEVPAPAQTPGEQLGAALVTLVKKAAGLDDVADEVGKAHEQAYGARVHAHSAHNNTEKLISLAKEEGILNQDTNAGVKRLIKKAKA